MIISTERSTSIHFEDISTVLQANGCPEPLSMPSQYITPYDHRLSESGKRVAVVDVFPSELEAKNAVLKMQRQGLRADQISIVAKDYQELGNSMTWKHVVANGGLALVLTRLGISIHSALQFADAIDDGKFLIVAVTFGKLIKHSPFWKTLDIGFTYPVQCGCSSIAP